MRFRLRTLLIVLAIAPPLVALVAISLLGLNREPIRVKGRVTYLGQPVAQGKVEFVLEPGGQNVFAATTNADGTFHLRDDGKSPRLKAGRYQVNVKAPGVKAPGPLQLIVDLREESTNELDFDLQ